MTKSKFIAHKEQVKEQNIRSFAESRGIPDQEAKREWEREYRNPIKGAVPTFQKRLDLFAR